MTRPAVELAGAVLVMLAGAWLIGWWAVGIVLVVLGALIAGDAILRDDSERYSKHQLHDEVLERWRRTR